MAKRDKAENASGSEEFDPASMVAPSFDFAAFFKDRVIPIRSDETSYETLKAIRAARKAKSTKRPKFDERHEWGTGHMMLTALMCATDEQFSRYLAAARGVESPDADDFFGDGFSEALYEAGPKLVSESDARALIRMPATLSSLRVRFALSKGKLPQAWSDAVARTYDLGTSKPS